MLLNCNHKLWFIAIAIGVFVCAFCDNIAYLSSYTFLFLALLLFHPFLKLFRSLSLLNYGDFIAIIHKDAEIFVQSLLWETNVKLFSATHPVEVKQFLTDDGIIVENFIKLSKLEQKYLVIVRSFYLPVLRHCRSEVLPVFVGDIESSWVIVRVIETSPLKI